MFQTFEKLRDPFPTGQPKRPPKTLPAFIWAGTVGLRSMLALMATLTAIIAAFDALLFAVLGQVVDWLSVSDPMTIWKEKKHYLIGFAIALAVSCFVVALQTTVKHQVLAVNMPMRLRWNYHRLMLGQSMEFYQDEFAGRITAKVMQTALAVRDVMFVLCDVTVMMGVYIITVIFLAGTLAPQMIWPFLIWLACYVISLIYFVPRLGVAGSAQADARAQMTGRVTDAYANITTVKLFSHTRREAQYARSAMREFLQTGYRQMRLVSRFEIVIHSLSMCLVGGMAGTGLWLWSQGVISVGTVAAATALSLRLNGMSHWIMWEMTGLFENIGTVQDGLNTLSLPRKVRDAPQAAELNVSEGRVQFDRVTFSYSKSAPDKKSTTRANSIALAKPVNVIEQLNLRIEPGERVGLVGRSGAGKSTVVNLLLRFYDIQDGQITIDGQDISLVTQDSLRAAIGVVSQDTSLLHRSLAENINYGAPQATESQIREAAARAQATDFIDHLTDPDGRTGLDAFVGERGVKLSGGQRQRIAIARVILKNAPILLLDEATSALDSEVESAIQDSLSDLMKGKTVIAIAHRLSTIAAMDRLIVIDKGIIAEEGDHESLLRKRGIYADLWVRQSGGFLGTDQTSNQIQDKTEK
ncbi:MAG: ABC transporter ATP-binding protein [Burkholderiaceae bacterium]